MASYELRLGRFYQLCEIQELDKIKSEYLWNKDIFQKHKYDLMHTAATHGHLDIIKWIMSLDDNLSSIHLYIAALGGACDSKNKAILDYLYSLRIFNRPDINYRAFSRVFTKIISNFDVDFMNHLYALFPFDIIGRELPFTSQYAFEWACNYHLISHARWVVSKKPYHYELTVNEVDEVVTFSRVVPEKERRWNQLKTVLWMSQVKPMVPHKSSIFRRIPDDVVQVEICSYL
jgi:hypothetical protein